MTRTSTNTRGKPVKKKLKKKVAKKKTASRSRRPSRKLVDHLKPEFTAPEVKVEPLVTHEVSLAIHMIKRRASRNYRCHTCGKSISAGGSYTRFGFTNARGHSERQRGCDDCSEVIEAVANATGIRPLPTTLIPMLQNLIELGNGNWTRTLNGILDRSIDVTPGDSLVSKVHGWVPPVVAKDETTAVIDHLKPEETPAVAANPAAENGLTGFPDGQ